MPIIATHQKKKKKKPRPILSANSFSAPFFFLLSTFKNMSLETSNNVNSNKEAHNNANSQREDTFKMPTGTYLSIQCLGLFIFLTSFFT